MAFRAEMLENASSFDGCAGLNEVETYEQWLDFRGHIGYCIRPSQRRKGYAKEQLRLTLERCREAGEKKVLVTCDPANAASERTILANGGVLASEVEDKPGLGGSGVIRRYWITIQE